MTAATNEVARAESALVVSLVKEGIGTAGEKLDETRLVLAVLDRALVLAGMVDTLEEFGVYAQPSPSRLVALFSDKTPSALLVFEPWAASNDLVVERLDAPHKIVQHHVLIAYRAQPNGQRRDVAALHITSEPTTEKAL